MNRYDEIEKSFKNRPHVVILGAGASVAAIPNGDKNGKKTSVMNGFLDKLGIRDAISSIGLKTSSDNLEDIYSEISESDRYSEIRLILDERIRSYFSSFEIPTDPTIYDYLLLSLRSKDLIATFNWDPLIVQAYRRVENITNDLPKIAYLHGNVMIGYCEAHKQGGLAFGCCPKCLRPFTKSRLLYPVKNKNYNSDPLTIYQWKMIKEYLEYAYLVTIFGYSAPKTDVEAIRLLKDAWGDTNDRNMEDFELIDIKREVELVATWKAFIHTHHYTYCTNFFDSRLARFPRRTIEELFDRTQNNRFTKSNYQFTPGMSFKDLELIALKLVQEEESQKDTFITLPER